MWNETGQAKKLELFTYLVRLHLWASLRTHWIFNSTNLIKISLWFILCVRGGGGRWGRGRKVFSSAAPPINSNIDSVAASETIAIVSMSCLAKLHHWTLPGRPTISDGVLLEQLTAQLNISSLKHKSYPVWSVFAAQGQYEGSDKQ